MDNARAQRGQISADTHDSSAIVAIRDKVQASIGQIVVATNAIRTAP